VLGDSACCAEQSNAFSIFVPSSVHGTIGGLVAKPTEQASKQNKDFAPNSKIRGAILKYPCSERLVPAARGTGRTSRVWEGFLRRNTESKAEEQAL